MEGRASARPTAPGRAAPARAHGDNATTIQDVTNPGNKPEWGNPNETMKALAWMGKNKVEVGKQKNHLPVPYMQSLFQEDLDER
jgi:hypothetical protein